jgi:alanyl-tRNA synthetase
VKKEGKKLTYPEAWRSFERFINFLIFLSFKRVFVNTKPVAHTKIQRYPVVARWRDDVEFVAAGIFCFQPYCVSGELKPPANPLICPQFCLRFNDLDCVGLTGRHFSGFVMIGIQAFMPKEDTTFSRDFVVENNFRWLTEELLLDPISVTFIEDVWAGGGVRKTIYFCVYLYGYFLGNLGPCIEYFIDGMEIGNMVFMEYKCDLLEGTWTPLDLRVTDVGVTIFWV